ncbi:MAG TPA: hypothetical protein VGB93_02950, partial [Methylovirgula sp.]
IRNWGTFSKAEFEAEFIGDPAHTRHKDLVALLQAPEFSHPIARVGNILGYTKTPPAMSSEIMFDDGADTMTDAILEVD